MNAQTILKQLQKWAEQGVLVSKSSLGMSYYEVNKGIATGVYFATSLRGILFTAGSERDLFEEWVKRGYIMDIQICKAHTPYLTLYGIYKACVKGELTCFSSLGKSYNIYIKNV